MLARYALRTAALAVAGLIPTIAVAETSNYQIPWKDVAARDCAIVLEKAADFTTVIAQCKGHIGVVLTVVRP
ncbi:hypothetical protein [Bradyrhizobium cytisi]|uniref:Uncharacterized protein n=1 Tax=Bradyrhizobium cytisi TaxID=515489 RepID=A0A5S4X0H4_9BRAD|nr:hypothetical protein [Bradyrhizobium cytisi]TYL87791.1 hypothetical protein FXB38_03155 [Bradyrhizobium cytisi]